MIVGNYRISWQHEPPFTRAALTLKYNGEEKAIGVRTARCSDKDQYCRETGRRVSLSKLLQFYITDKKIRAEFWEAFRTLTKKPKWTKVESHD